MAYCPDCGAEIKKSDKFCPGCGRRLVGEAKKPTVKVKKPISAKELEKYPKQILDPRIVAIQEGVRWHTDVLWMGAILAAVTLFFAGIAFLGNRGDIGAGLLVIVAVSVFLALRAWDKRSALLEELQKM